jgi:hypothetical protein
MPQPSSNNALRNQLKIHRCMQLCSCATHIHMTSLRLIPIITKKNPVSPAHSPHLGHKLNRPWEHCKGSAAQAHVFVERKHGMEMFEIYPLWYPILQLRSHIELIAADSTNSCKCLTTTDIKPDYWAWNIPCLLTLSLINISYILTIENTIFLIWSNIFYKWYWLIGREGFPWSTS